MAKNSTRGGQSYGRSGRQVVGSPDNPVAKDPPAKITRTRPKKGGQ